MQGVELLYYRGRYRGSTKQKSVCSCLIYLMHFVQHILLAISTTLCLFLEFESVLESLHSGKCDCHLMIGAGNVFSRFRFQVGWLEPNTFLPTRVVCYLNDLMSDLGI